MLEISPASEADFDEIWKIFQPILQAGGTYVYSPDTSKAQAYSIWYDLTFQTYLAKVDGEVVGAYVIRPGHRDLGSHICNAAYIITNKYRGKGYGEAMGLHSIEQAKKLGYRAMQFNYVVSTNKTAISLWNKIGFKIVGTIPTAYNHPEHGYVDIHIMHQSLLDD